jgi:ATP-binding cassette subfamily B (MDR/TAP) protein 1
MAALREDRPPPPPASNVEAEAVVVQAQLLEVSTAQKDVVLETTQETVNAPATKTASSGGLKNYFVCFLFSDSTPPANTTCQRVFAYGTKFDYLLIVMCCLTSIGSGIAMPLMNVVFGKLQRLQSSAEPNVTKVN